MTGVLSQNSPLTLYCVDLSPSKGLWTALFRLSVWRDVRWWRRHSSVVIDWTVKRPPAYSWLSFPIEICPLYCVLMQLFANGSASCHVRHVALTWLKVNMPAVTAARLLDFYLVVDGGLQLRRCCSSPDRRGKAAGWAAQPSCWQWSSKYSQCCTLSCCRSEPRRFLAIQLASLQYCQWALWTHIFTLVAMKIKFPWWFHQCSTFSVCMLCQISQVFTFLGRLITCLHLCYFKE